MPGREGNDENGVPSCCDEWRDAWFADCRTFSSRNIGCLLDSAAFYLTIAVRGARAERRAGERNTVAGHSAESRFRRTEALSSYAERVSMTVRSGVRQDVPPPAPVVPPGFPAGVQWGDA
ncbi:hypothetical protein GCM10017600_68330 [Streptosporangium carneum]|uniref:Uncharacterized protein n=1 Tax=Streptosporangium carneum TaxID=47481 RepID=A0A9W6MGR9_9ACTN|nr:hypothetical protein GCM10017600_68330 [Streptosporangium carneum]